ncbi:hypothetical protein N7520_009178 [Penicillium odoratum]|uniref:uncharacterized protein n=1 Tax=Penicillium odoratum TaxID=1167516 RepID=UPI0025474626|nr:uncharacterized protein N7520_009178 [Penicillium odoratum]KAJ5752261.1 hypothetical protein N7520_009178 [Penicillium odoratum]
MKMSLGRFTISALLGSASAGTLLSSSPASSQAHIHTAICTTILGTTSESTVPTTTITRRIHDPTPIVVFSTVQDTVTVTPSVSTLTETDYETSTITFTDTTATDVFSTTSTEFDTATLTVTPDDITSTVFSTISVTLTSTSTVATSDGFTPIADTLATASAYRKREVPLVNDCAPWIDDYEYPQEVVCREKVILKTTTTSIVTETPLTTTAVAPSTTVTATSTIISSSVVIPSDVSTTLSYSITSTITETSTAPAVTDTVTATTTVTAVTTTSSFAACATNNIAGAPLSSDFGDLEGEYIYSLDMGAITDYTLSTARIDTPYDCCVNCQESSTCVYSYFSVYGYCTLVESTTCSVSSEIGYAYLATTADSGVFQASNGNCGQVREGAY